MKSFRGIRWHRLMVDLLGQTAGNAQIRAVDEIDRRAARGTDKVIDRSQLLHQLPERLGIQHTQVNGVRRKAAVVVERNVKARMAVANTLYPTDQGGFHHFPRL